MWCHPGGGPTEYDRAGNRYDDPTAGLTRYAGDYYAWDNGISNKTKASWPAGSDPAAGDKGVSEVDCMMCHLNENYNNLARNYCITSPGVGSSMKFRNGATLGLTYTIANTTDKGSSTTNPSCDITGYNFNDGTNAVIPASKIARSKVEGCALCHFADESRPKGTTAAGVGPGGNPLDFTAWQKVVNAGTVTDSDTGEPNTTTWKLAKGRAEFGKRGESLRSPTFNPDVHMDGGMTCADCHYALSGSFSALMDGANVIQPALLVNKIDHQFAKGNNLPDGKNMDQLDNTVTCEGCHIDGTHPNAGSAPVPTHPGLPALHLSKISCRTCHIPSVNFVKKQVNADFSSATYPMDAAPERGQFAEGGRINMKPLYIWRTSTHGAEDYKITPVALGSTALWKNINDGLPYNKRFATGASQKLRQVMSGTTAAPFSWTLNSPQGGDTALIINTTDEISKMVTILQGGTPSGAPSGFTPLAASSTIANPTLQLYLNTFSLSHNVKPITAALGAGGCVDCHTANNSPIFSNVATAANAVWKNDKANGKGVVFFQPAEGGGLQMTCDGGNCTSGTKRISASFTFPCPDNTSATVDLTQGKSHGQVIDNAIEQTDVLCYSDFQLSKLANAGMVGVDPARFNWYAGSECYEVNFDASMNSASTLSWNFGGSCTNSPSTTAAVTSCEYSAAGSYSVTLTLDAGTGAERTRTMIVTAKGKNSVPTTGMTLSTDVADTSDATGMSATVTDASAATSCGGAIAGGTAVVLWGDGTTSVTTLAGGDSWTHQYSVPGTYTVRYSVKDTNGNKSMSAPVTITVPDLASAVCAVEGDITGTAIAANTLVTLKMGGTVVKQGKTDASGRFSIPGVKAGSEYTIIPSRNGYSFAPDTPGDDTFTLDCAANTDHDFTATSIW